MSKSFCASEVTTLGRYTNLFIIIIIIIIICNVIWRNLVLLLLMNIIIVDVTYLISGIYTYLNVKVAKRFQCRYT